MKEVKMKKIDRKEKPRSQEKNLVKMKY